MKLSIVKVANAIPCGPKTEHVFQDAEYEITEYDNFKIRIKHRRTNTEVSTSFFNAVYWKEIAESGSSLPGEPSPKRTKA